MLKHVTGVSDIIYTSAVALGQIVNLQAVNANFTQVCNEESCSQGCTAFNPPSLRNQQGMISSFPV